MYDYKARVVKVVDGDTMHLEVELGLDTRQRITVRLFGINSPEMSTEEGKAAREFAAAWVGEYGWLNIKDPQDVYFWVRVTTVKDQREKYGRYLATVLPWEVGAAPSLNEELVANGHAVPYLP